MNLDQAKYIIEQVKQAADYETVYDYGLEEAIRVIVRDEIHKELDRQARARSTR